MRMRRINDLRNTYKNRYAVFSAWTWFWMVWAQVWATFDFLVLWFYPHARSEWLFIVAAIVQPVSALGYLVLGRKRRGIVRLTAEGDHYRWQIE